ncbi:hypothetical protein F4561_005088 [Lipingzhangella halophila]|uniref:Uncharacterized protein n=1 Tax=Lipingzhangella halophila TaxID=1783352 RepID=A0A7W7RMF9_9ACTN|nr:hypothetical protein [Lipingzhangella halophila]
MVKIRVSPGRGDGLGCRGGPLGVARCLVVRRPHSDLVPLWWGSGVRGGEGGRVRARRAARGGRIGAASLCEVGAPGSTASFPTGPDPSGPAARCERVRTRPPDRVSGAARGGCDGADSGTARARPGRCKAGRAGCELPARAGLPTARTAAVERVADGEAGEGADRAACEHPTKEGAQRASPGKRPDLRPPSYTQSDARPRRRRGRALDLVGIFVTDSGRLAVPCVSAVLVVRADRSSTDATLASDRGRCGASY